MGMSKEASRQSHYCLINSEIVRDIEVSFETLRFVSEAITPALNAFQPLVNNQSVWCCWY